MKTLLNIDELSTEQKLGMLMCARYFHPNDKENLEYTLELIKKSFSWLCSGASFST